MKRILVIDDDPNVVTTIKMYLEKTGEYEVLAALDGKQGLKLAREEEPDLILLDIIMPGMDGLKVLEQLGTKEPTCFIPVIMLTGLDSEPARTEANYRYVEHFLTKPFDLKDLGTKISSVLALRQAGRKS